jgi:hypothetical protein
MDSTCFWYDLIENPGLFRAKFVIGEKREKQDDPGFLGFIRWFYLSLSPKGM